MAIQPQANRWDRDLNAIRSVALGQLPAEGLQVHLVVVGGIGGFDHNRIEIPVQGQQGIQVSLETRQGVGVKSPPVLEGLNPQLQARERSPNVMGNAIEAPLTRFGLAVERLEQQVDAMAEQQQRSDAMAKIQPNPMAHQQGEGHQQFIEGLPELAP